MIKLNKVSDKEDITIINIMEYKPYYNKENGYKDDVLLVLYKDKNNDKKLEIFPRPKVDIYFTKDDNRNFTTPRAYLEESTLERVTVRNSMILQEIEKRIKKDNSAIGKSFKSIIDESYRTRNYRLKKEIYKYPYTLYGDIDLDSRTRIDLVRRYNVDHPHDINIAFMDIEADMYQVVDGKYKRFDESYIEAGLNRINMINIAFLFNPKTKRKDGNIHFYNFMLVDDKTYPQQKEIIENMDIVLKNIQKEIEDLDIVIKGESRNLLKDMKMKIKIHHIECYSELELLDSYFKVLHWASPDVTAIYNLGYDMPKIHKRYKYLGENPVDKICDPNIPKELRYINYRVDERFGVDWENKNTYYKGTFSTNYVCQLILQAAVNKGRKDRGRNELDNIGFIEAGIRKLEFSSKRINVKNAPYYSFLEFFRYSFRDVMVQVAIEHVSSYINTLMLESNSTGTSTNKVYKLNTYLRNVFYLIFFEANYVPGNNRNIDYTKSEEEMNEEMLLLELAEKLLDEYGEIEEDEEALNKAEEIINSTFIDSPFKKHSLKAGFVADPRLMAAVGMELIKFIKSNHYFHDCADKDYKAHYPNEVVHSNISGPTEVGRVCIPVKLSDRQNTLRDPKYVPGAEYCSDLICDDMVILGNIYHGLGDVKNLLVEVDNFMKNKKR